MSAGDSFGVLDQTEPRWCLTLRPDLLHPTLPAVGIMREHSLCWDAGNDVKNIKRYTAGGFHPICLGDVVSSHDASPNSPIPNTESPAWLYWILHKLGHSVFATVWLAKVLNQPSWVCPCPSCLYPLILLIYHRQHYVALKICAANADPDHKINIFNYLSKHESETPNLLQLRDNFSLQGPNGTHTVLVHDILGNLFSFVSLPSGCRHAKMLCRKITHGIASLHCCGIVHGGECSYKVINCMMSINLLMAVVM
jgi:hypothetical protein